MKVLIRKVLFSDRISQMLLLAIFISLAFTISSSVYTGNIERDNIKLSNKAAEVKRLSKGLLDLKNYVASKEKKIGLTKTSGPVSFLEKILSALYIKASMIKPLEKKRVKEFYEENAELVIQGIDLNRIVNLLYKIEHSPALMKINSSEMNTTFEDPDKFNLKLTVSLISKN